MSSHDRQKPSTMPGLPVTTTEQIVAALPDILLEVSEDGYFREVYSGRETDFYTSPDGFLNKHYSQVLPDSVTQSLDEGFAVLKKENAPTTVSYMLPDAEGLQFFECRLLPMENGNILAVIRNMTDSWRAKTELEQSESRYRTLVNNIPGIVYRCHIDKDWTAIFVSPAIKDLVGYPAEDFMARRQSLSGVTHPEDRQRVQREVTQAIEEQRPYQLSYRMIDADGEIRQVTERGQAVYAEYDETTYLDGVVLDVTEIHQMRQRLLLSNKMAAVGSLAAGVAHEINNPLAIAVANLEFITDEISAHTGDATDHPLQDVQGALDKVQESIGRVRSIIDDLRTFTDAADGRADKLDLMRLTRWATQRARSRTEHSQKLNTKLASVPKIWASEIGIVQVIWNLIDNGLEALDRRSDGGGSVDIELSHHDDRVILEVCDDGLGMSADVANRAFEPFFTTKPVGQGAGLGLFVCQGLVEGMDGTIEFETEPGQGTCVRISFPTFHAPYVAANGD